MLKGTLHAPSTVSRGPSGSPSVAAPGSIPDSPLPLAAGASQTPSSPPQLLLTSAVRVGLPRPASESASEQLSEPGTLRALPEHCPGRPRSHLRRQPLESEPELLREAGPYRREAEP
ncbi:hypothetical protein J1605_018653 [Eschrichtius robustus]|uniref:Uncharacterized protein n=1 Tax=Eschrichtius robustus TaxID=9764 RepID=A0AB34HVN5_ESCRO|nr:hypothetical protein J1605_018653 [Eschrichtius robustus]